MHLLRAGELQRSHIQVILLHWPWLVNMPLALLACTSAPASLQEVLWILQSRCRMMSSWELVGPRVAKLKPYQQKTRGYWRGAGAQMGLAGEGCMAFPVVAVSYQKTTPSHPNLSRPCAGLYLTTGIVRVVMQWLRSRLMRSHRGPSAAAQGCFNPAWLHNASFWEARSCCDSLQRCTQSALYNYTQVLPACPLAKSAQLQVKITLAGSLTLSMRAYRSKSA